MGLFGNDDYRVVKKGGLLSHDQVVLDRVSLEEAERYVDSKQGIFGGDGNTYVIENRHNAGSWF